VSRAFRFVLFVAGDSPRSAQAAANLRRLATERLEGRAEIAVVDVLVDPARAESDRILTTPTLVKEAPEPARRVTGDLSDLDRVASALGLTSLWDVLQ
jgi:circadian clock protein KaiB